VLFECLTGRRVHEAPNIIALVAQHLETPTPPVRSVAPELPEALARVVDRALAKSKEDRWPSAAAMLRALDAA